MTAVSVSFSYVGVKLTLVAVKVAKLWRFKRVIGYFEGERVNVIRSANCFTHIWNNHKPRECSQELVKLQNISSLTVLSERFRRRLQPKASNAFFKEPLWESCGGVWTLSAHRVCEEWGTAKKAAGPVTLWLIVTYLSTIHKYTYVMRWYYTHAVCLWLSVPLFGSPLVCPSLFVHPAVCLPRIYPSVSLSICLSLVCLSESV